MAELSLGDPYPSYLVPAKFTGTDADPKGGEPSGGFSHVPSRMAMTSSPGEDRPGDHTVQVSVIRGRMLSLLYELCNEPGGEPRLIHRNFLIVVGNVASHFAVDCGLVPAHSSTTIPTTTNVSSCVIATVPEPLQPGPTDFGSPMSCDFDLPDSYRTDSDQWFQSYSQNVPISANTEHEGNERPRPLPHTPNPSSGHVDSTVNPQDLHGFPSKSPNTITWPSGGIDRCENKAGSQSELDEAQETSQNAKANTAVYGGDDGIQMEGYVDWGDDADQRFLWEEDNEVVNGENDRAPAEGITGLQADHPRRSEDQDASVSTSVADTSQLEVNGDADNGAAVGLARACSAALCEETASPDKDDEGLSVDAEEVPRDSNNEDHTENIKVSHQAAVGYSPDPLT